MTDTFTGTIRPTLRERFRAWLCRRFDLVPFGEYAELSNQSLDRFRRLKNVQQENETLKGHLESLDAERAQLRDDLLSLAAERGTLRIQLDRQVDMTHRERAMRFKAMSTAGRSIRAAERVAAAAIATGEACTP
jgi:predicted nuclease with TOPRIM domain